MLARSAFIAAFVSLASAANAQLLPIQGTLCTEEGDIRFSATEAKGLDGACPIVSVEAAGDWLTVKTSCTDTSTQLVQFDISAREPWIAVLQDDHEYPLQRCD